MKLLHRCSKCAEYTLEEEHCGRATQLPYPPKWSPEDRYAEYRRKAREQK